MRCDTCRSRLDDDGECEPCNRRHESRMRPIITAANLLAHVINERAGVSEACKPTTVRGISPTKDSGVELANGEVDFDLRFTVNVLEDGKRAMAAELIHVAVGLLSGGLSGTAEVVACRLVADAARYFEEEARAEAEAAQRAGKLEGAA